MTVRAWLQSILDTHRQPPQTAGFAAIAPLDCRRGHVTMTSLQDLPSAVPVPLVAAVLAPSLIVLTTQVVAQSSGRL